MPRTPAYRQRPGRNQALVTLTDSLTKRRKDFWLGEYGTPESRELYHRVIADWEAGGRRWPKPPVEPDHCDEDGCLKLNQLLRDYHRFGRQYHDYGEFRSFIAVMRLMKQYFGRTDAAKFGPKKLRILREQMVKGDAKGDRPRKPWTRRYVNQQVQRVRRIFKWAAAHEMVPAGVYQALCTVEPLKRGRCEARETPKVGPASDHLIEKVLPHLSRQARALVELQLLTGARAGELVELRVCDLEMDEKTGIWTYRPARHKNASRERERVIYFGPRAQEVLRPFVTGRATTDYLFSPAEAEADRRAIVHDERKTPLSCGNRPGTNVVEDPAKKPGDHYTTDSYRRAIEYACRRAFPPPAPLARRESESKQAWRERLRKTGKWEDLKAWEREHRFSPHQLRHSAGTLIRREFGLEAAQLALGHASAVVTDAVYAERDHAKVVEVMRRIG